MLERLRAQARTPRGRVRCTDATGLFETEPDEARARLTETSEARRLIEGPGPAPLGGVPDLAPILRRLGKEGLLSAHELGDVASALASFHAVRDFFARRGGDAPRLAAVAGALTELRDLEAGIRASFDAEGEVRDAASSALAQARAAARQLAAETQRRVEALLQDSGVAPALSDAYVTVRADRYVLPVRADARGRVRGIVHDASASGATLFIEPEALIELNNRLKRAELDVQRETLRILRALSARAAEALPAIEANLSVLEQIDLAFARGQLSHEMQASEPEVGNAGAFRLPQLRHPLLAPESAVANDVRLDGTTHVLLLSGPNAGGKTVLMKSVALAALFVRAGLHVAAAPGARVDLVDALLADIGDEQDLRESLSTFSAHVANLAHVLAEASPRTLVVLDEIGAGTDPGEGAALAQAILERLADSRARVVATTHFGLLKEMAGVDARFLNASFEFDPHTLAPTYRLRAGVAGVSSAMAVAARMGIGTDVLDRANALLGGEDRRLDRLLGELAASRASLETEQREARRLRAESEAVRTEYRERLERLQAKRDALYRGMREDLDRAFRDAHAQVAAVIRDLQRGGGAREAAHARERLHAIAEEAQEAAAASGAMASQEPEPLDPVDWRRAHAGDAVRVRGGACGVLVALPDRRGRAVVQVGSARLLIPAAQLGAASPALDAAPPSPAAADRAETPTPLPAAHEEGLLHAIGPRLDLRGLRADEAIDRVDEALDRAAAHGENALVLVHGLGTGALRDAIRRHLAASPYVRRYAAAAREDGGDGVTLVRLEG